MINRTMRDHELRIAALYGLRWCNNILIEILANRIISVSPKGRELLSQAISLLAEAQDCFQNRKE